jgi:hypothetical protein
MNMRPTVTKKCGLSVTVAAAQKDKSYESYIISSPTSASVLIEIGVDRERFIEHFGPLGRIAFVPQGGQPCPP